MTNHIPETMLLSEAALAKEWNTPEEDEAWASLSHTIEPASPAECAKVERRVREYHKNPQSFVPLKDIR